MSWALVLLAAVTLTSAAHAQEIDYAHYTESVQIIIDDGLQEATASVVLQSTDTGDIMLPKSLENDLRENERIIAVIVTNTGSCILGVSDETCVIVNMARIPEETNIFMVQDGAREVADRYIPLLNEAFGVESEFHSVFVHHSNEQNKALAVPGIVVGYNTVSVTYTTPHQDTTQLFDILASHLLVPAIADGGGFVDTARTLAGHQNSTITFVAVPGTTDIKMLLRVAQVSDHTLGETVDPLYVLGIDRVEPSAYFDDGFYPLNSLIRVAVVSEGRAVSGAEADIIQMSGGRPVDVAGAGWFFDPPEGTLIRGTYLMGQDGGARVGETALTLRPWNGTIPTEQDDLDHTDAAAGESEGEMFVEIAVVVGIVVAAGAAAIFYLKGYRRTP